MRSRLSAAIRCGAALVLCAAHVSGAQTPARGDAANSVRLEVYPTEGGELVADLRQDELTLLENDVPQTLERFAFVSPDVRSYVVFLDTYHSTLEGPSNARLAVVRFLDRLLGPRDEVALAYPGIVANPVLFTAKAAAISDVMQAGRSADADPKEKLYATCYPNTADSKGIAEEMTARRREQLALDALELLVANLRSAREGRKAVLVISEGWRLFTESRDLARPLEEQRGSARGAFGRRQRSRDPTSPATGVDMRECDTDRAVLARANNARRLRDLADTANRANVTFYPLYPPAVAAGDGRPAGATASDRDSRASSLRTMAADTDGLAVLTAETVDAGLHRIAADMSAYYLVAYQSSNTKLDGRFRNIDARVTRRGVRVRARRGYRGLTPEDLVRPFGRAAESATGTVTVDPRATFRVMTSVWNLGEDAETVSVWVTGELDGAVRRQLAWTAGASGEIVVVGADGAQVTAANVQLDADDRSFSRKLAPAGGWPPGDYALRVTVRPHADASLPLSEATRLTIPASGSVLGDALMWRRGPSTGPRYAPTADPRFTRNERIRLEIPTTDTGSAGARMLDRAGNPMRVPVQVSGRQDESGSFRWIVADAVLAPLAPGDYSIEVSIDGQKQTAGFKVVP